MDNNDKEEHVEDTENLNPEHISNYLRGLRDRLKQTVQHHNDIIQISVNLIKEIGDVPTMLELLHSKPGLNTTKIKRLIMEFENIQTGDSSQDLTSSAMIDLNTQITYFRELNESQLLRNSLMCFKHAKDSLGQVESLLNEENNVEHSSPHPSVVSMGSYGTCRCLRDKIQAFNTGSHRSQNPSQHFTSCFYAASSPNIVTGNESNQTEIGTYSITNSGYEGGVDSELDQKKITDS